MRYFWLLFLLTMFVFSCAFSFSQHVGESLEVVSKRVDAAEAVLEVVSNDLDADCLRLLEAACNRAGFTPRDVTWAIDVAVSIAALDQSKTIKAMHLAEAIAYNLFARPVLT